MKVVLFGATDMVGRGVLRECLAAPDVTQVLAVGRSATGQQHDKLRELVHPDLSDFSSVEDALSGYDACFYCLGVSSVGMSAFRPAFIQPLDGIVPRTKLYRIGYVIFAPLYPLLRAVFPGFVTTTEDVGKAMLRVARSGAPKSVIENRDIHALAAQDT